MKRKYLINVYLERYDRDKYVKPYFINLPHSKEIEKCYFEEHWLPGAKLVDSKTLGIMLHFFYALSEPNEKFIKLEVGQNQKESMKEAFMRCMTQIIMMGNLVSLTKNV